MIFDDTTLKLAVSYFQSVMKDEHSTIKGCSAAPILLMRLLDKSFRESDEYDVIIEAADQYIEDAVDAGILGPGT